MPDFDKDLNPIIKREAPAQLNDISLAPRTYSASTERLSNYQGSESIYDKLAQDSKSADFTPKGIFVTNAQLEANKRYRIFNPTVDNNEDYFAYGQSVADKAANGILKGVNLAATTIAGGFGMLYGAAKSPFTGRLADIWDNEVMRGLDDWNTKVDQEFLPNYYTDAEKNAAWYSTDNWFKANFLYDKLIKNAGFAVGAMVGGNIANAGLLRAGAALGKLASAAATTAEASQGFKLFTPLLRNTARAFSVGKNVEAAGILEKEISSIADLSARSSRLGEIAKDTNLFNKINEYGRRTAVAAYASSGEASFEALQTANQYREKLINEYKNTYGEEPTGDALANINSTSEQVGKASFLGNLAVLGITEYVQLPYLLGSSYSPNRRVANSLMGDTEQVALKGGVYEAIKPTTKFGKLYDKATGVSRYVFDPKESAQEGLQYALQVGTQNYYNKAYQSNDANAYVDGVLYGLFGRGEYDEGVGALVSKEGMESMVLGGITGGLMQASRNYQQSKASNANTNAFLEILNNTPGFKESFQDRLNSGNRGTILQQQQQDAVLAGDKQEAKDLDHDIMHNYLSTRIKYGRFDMVMDDVADLRMAASTEQGLVALKEQGVANINDTVESYQQRLSQFENTAKSINELYSALDLRYSGVVNPDGTRKYTPDVIDKMVYAASKIVNYDTRIPQVNVSLTEASVNTFDILQSIIKENKPNKEATDATIQQINDLDVTSEVKDELKTALSDVIEMSIRRKLFMEEYDSIKENPENFQLKPEFEFGAQEELPVTVKQKEIVEGEKKPVVVDKELEVGREYSLKQPIRRDGNAISLAPKITVLSQTLGGEFEVKLPNGSVSFLTPEQFKDFQVSEEDNYSDDLKDILNDVIDKTLAKAKYADIVLPEEGDKLAFINSLNNKELIDEIEKGFNAKAKDYLKAQADAQARRDKMSKSSGKINKMQEELFKSSGNISTGDDEVDTVATKESMRKAVERLFTSTTSASMDWEKTLAPHVTRFNTFMNKVNGFKDRKNIKAILVTANQQDALGLKGLAEMSFNAGNLDVSTINDKNNGFVAAVFIHMDKKGVKHFIGENGEIIGTVGEPVDLNKVVFSTMPAVSLYDSKGNPRFRSEQEEEAILEEAAWKEYRSKLFAAPADSYMIFDFGVSKGIGNKGETKNGVGDILVPESKIATQEGLIQISTKGYIAHEDGNNYTFPVGRPVLQYNETLDYLNNSTFTKPQAVAIYESLKKISDAINNETSVDPKYLKFLQNILYWNTEGAASSNKIYITGSVLHIGDKTYDFANLDIAKDKLIQDLQSVYSSVNNKTLSAGVAVPFTEIYVDSEGKLQDRTWKNYQSYLLSSKNPDGSKRTPPLTTTIVKSTPAVPYTHKQKYAYLIGMELPRQVVKKEEVVEEEPTKVKTYKATAGDVKYTTSTDAAGNTVVTLESDNPTIIKMAEDPTMLAKATEVLKSIGLYDDLDTPNETVAKFAANVISASIVKEAVAPKEEVVKETPKTFNKRKGPNNPEYRRVGAMGIPRISAAEAALFIQWAAEKVPGIPYEFLDNIINTHDGEKAWGAFENGVAKIFKGAARGTEYHEVFEGVWKGFLSDAQQQALLDEFKAKSGSFTDRATGKKIDYADATDEQAKERIADDFADFRLGKLPAKSVSEKILKFFKAIVDFFKSFVTKPSLKEELFKAIDTGEFKERVFPESKKNDAAEYRRVPGLTQQQVNDFVQDITARVFIKIFSDNSSLFNIENLTASEIFDDIKNQFEEEGVFDDISEGTYYQLVDRTKDFLKTYRIEFDEDSRVTVNDVEANRNDYAAEAFSVNFKKSSPYAVKLLVGTLIQTKGLNQQNASSLAMPEYAESSTGGFKLVPFGQAFTTLMNRLSNTTDVPTFINKLFNLAKENSDYVRLFKRLGGDLKSGKINFNDYKPHDWRLFINFYQVFTKQKPDAFAQFTDGIQTYTGAANQASLVKQLSKEWIENMKALANKSGSIISYDRPNKIYKVGDVTGIKIGNPKEISDFLGKLGIDFPVSSISRVKKKKAFANAISSIKTSLEKSGQLITLKGKTLGIAGPLATIAEQYVIVNSPNEDSTYFNTEGKRQQSFTDSNAPSYFESVFNSADTLAELMEKMPQLQDVFSKNSEILRPGGLFFDENGERIAEIKVGYIQGVKDVNTGKGQSISRITIGERYITEINQNLKGQYYILIPADGSTEWMMNLDNSIPYTAFAAGEGYARLGETFLGYLKDEIALAQDAKNRRKLENVGAKAKELRFLKDILPQNLLDKVAELIDNEASTEAVDTFISENTSAISDAVTKFASDTVTETKKALTASRELVQLGEDRYSLINLDDDFEKSSGLNKTGLSEQQLNDLLGFANSNYIINNIEFHKILFGDPYQFKIKNGILDETKRIKSFLSPRRITVNFPELNNWLNNEYNTVGDIQLTPDDYGYHEFKDFAKTVTLSDIDVKDGFYPETNEADAASWIIDGTYREVKLKNGQWSDEAEEWHQWQMAYTRQNVPGYEYTNEALRKQDERLMEQPESKYKIEELKPIVSGNKFNKTNIDIVLDKFSQMPLYYKAVQGTNLGKLYEKMFKEGYDYAVVESGRKVGIESKHNLYTKDGAFNEEPFNNTINVPWSAYGIQVENSYEKDKLQTLGSQLTKLSTVDLYNNGEAINAEAEKEVKHNTDVLKAMMMNGYEELLKKLGIEDLGDSFQVVDKTTVANTLRQEILRLELSENGIDSVSINPLTGDFYAPLESSTNYVQIKNILYSIVDKSIVSPKVSGFSAVQVPVTGWEKAGESRGENKTKSALKFYTKEDPYMEVYLPAWFRNKLPKDKFKNDEELISYLNKTDILKGIGFRIPTQALSSVEVFRVKGFLPDFMGRTVVVPSEITTKAGSDFDIDKLNLYLKNVYVTPSGEIKSVPFFGFGEEAKEKIKQFIFDEDIKALFDIKEEVMGDREDDYGTLADKLYKQSLENEYFRSLEKLITMPDNFERLTSPNTAKSLSKIASNLDKLTASNETEIKNRLLDRNYMTNLRHAFVTAKKWVGIAATNITGNSLAQKEEIFVIDDEIQMSLPHNTVNIDGKDHISISGDKDKAGEYISDKLSMYANAFVDVAKDPYILKIIKSNRTVGVFMFLERAGVPMETVAMFMNQPIITEYIKYLDSIKASSTAASKLKHADVALKMFPTTEALITNSKVSVDNLENNISTYYTGTLTDAQNAEQHKILREFATYAALADNNLQFTQAINYDTTSFKNADDLYRKQVTTQIAEQTNLLVSPSKILSSSFLGQEERLLDRATDALGAILKFNQADFRQQIKNAISGYASNIYLSGDNFTKIAEKLGASFLDYIIQTKMKNLDINDLLMGSESVAVKLETAKAAHPEMKILRDLVVESTPLPDGTFTVKLRSNPKEAFDENLYIGYMRELRDNPDTNALYKDLVKIAIVQGTYQSAVSIKNIIPLEDYAEIVSPIVSAVVVDENIKNFAKNNMFQRNNWKDDLIVPSASPAFYDVNQGFPIGEDEYGEEIYQYRSLAYPALPNLKIEITDRKILAINRDADLIKVPRIVKVENDMVDIMTGRTVTKYQYAIRKQKGDSTLTQTFGYQAVKYADGTPLRNDKGYKIYKLVNLYGDGQYASEYYSSPAPSVLNNNTMKIDTEIPDADIIRAFYPQTKEELLPSQGEIIQPEGLPAIENKNQNNCK